LFNFEKPQTKQTCIAVSSWQFDCHGLQPFYVCCLSRLCTEDKFRERSYSSWSMSICFSFQATG